MVENNIVHADNISISINDTPLLSDINLSLGEKETIVLMGPGGCGKSTLLKMLAGLVEPTKGKVYQFGEDIYTLTPKRRMEVGLKTGFVFQNYALIDSMTVERNINFVLHYHHRLPAKETAKKVSEMMELVRLNPHFLNYYPNELSGGMKKRVGIARAIIYNPQVLFLDDPTAGLDPITGDAIIRVIRTLKEKFGISIIAVTSELAITKKLADKVGLIFNNRLHSFDTLENILSSQDEMVRQFIDGKKDGPINYR